MHIYQKDKKVLARTFLLEFLDWSTWNSQDLQEGLALVKASGLKSFAPTRASPITATVPDHMRIFYAGFDVVYTYNIDNAVVARQAFNKKNLIFPSR